MYFEKHLSLVLILVIFSSLLKAQTGFKDTIYVNDIFVQPSENIANQKIIIVDSSIEANQLSTRILNWIGKSFKNADKVITSKTESQVVVDYITQTYFGWKVRLVIEFKKGKIRYTFIDNGNTYRSVPYAIREGSMHIQSYFEKKGFVKSSGYWEKHIYAGIIQWKNELNNIALNFENFMSKSEPNKDDW
jgi:hypothetical protein